MDLIELPKFNKGQSDDFKNTYFKSQILKERQKKILIEKRIKKMFI